VNLGLQIRPLGGPGQANSILGMYIGRTRRRIVSEPGFVGAPPGNHLGRHRLAKTWNGPYRCFIHVGSRLDAKRRQSGSFRRPYTRYFGGPDWIAIEKMRLAAATLLSILGLPSPD
jgi:hypothetical protein